jgi:2-polyprenyl-3-methyl-5-hydroxy-6-metoxy-1,4-benzoquinol methylase
MKSTNPEYALRLQRLSGRWWKKLVPNPYRWNVRRLATGRVLDVGCGIGRCLDFIRPRGVGVDPNTTAVEMCRHHGLEAYTPEEFAAVHTTSEPASEFDTLLCAHVLEHLDELSGVELIRANLPHIATGGRVVLITPQERGQRSDSTHVRFMDTAALTSLVANCGLELERVSSFPLPRAFGRWFVYNETVVVARLRSR